MANKKSTKKAAPAPTAPPEFQDSNRDIKEEVQKQTTEALAAQPLFGQELAYQAIASEIECQRLGGGSDEDPETVPEYILSFDELVADLKAAHSNNLSPFYEGPLGIIREIGAMAIRCLEKNGAPLAEMTPSMKMNLLEELAYGLSPGEGLAPETILDILFA